MSGTGREKRKEKLKGIKQERKELKINCSEEGLMMRTMVIK